MSAVLESGPNTAHLLAEPVELELVSGEGQSLEAVRHVFLAADLLDPQRSRDVGLKYGGEEVDSRCLRRTNGKIPRCFITPLELSVEWMPLDLFPTGMEQFALKPKLTKEEDDLSRAKIFKPLFGLPYYPGHQIVDVTNLTTGRRGIVEIETFRGAEYKDTEAIQNLFFPADFQLPIELSKTCEHIERVAGSVADPDAKDTANFMLMSCDHSRDFMLEKVSIANTQLDERVTGTFVHRLTPKIRNYMAQLGIKPRSEPATQIQDVVNSALSRSITPEMMAQMQTQNAELVAAAIAGIGPAIADAVAKALSSALETKAPTPAKSAK